MKKVFLSLITITLLFSCSKEDFDINRDPDNLTDLPLSKLLPGGMVGLVGAEGSYEALVGGFWSQFWTQSNASNQYKELDDYSMSTTSPLQGGWAAMYDALNDIHKVRVRAQAEGNWNYYLMATTLEAQGMQVIVDLYDRAPYSEAFNVEILQPNYDSGQEIYDQLVANLQEALSQDLSASEGEIPGDDDFLFEGNMARWTEFANTMLLKLYMRQTEVRPDVAQNGITALINSGATFLNSDAAMTQFADEANRSNPLYESDRRQLNVGTNLRASNTMFSFLDANADPRLDEFYGAGSPMNQGDFNNTGIAASTISVVNLSPVQPVYLMSREESLLLQAEALERYFGGAGAEALYDAAVIENFNKWGADGTPFVQGGGAYEYPSGGTFDEKLEAIITQKWIASFPGNGFEAFFEQNRTGYPQISSVPQTDAAYIPGQLAYSINGTTGGEFPRRVVFAESSTSTNPNAPTLVDITEPVWWDVD